MKITIATNQGPVEVDAELAPYTAGLLAVHQDPPSSEEEDDDASETWLLTHVPTGYALGRYVRPANARNVARQLYAAASDAFTLTDPEAFTRAVPRDVRHWVQLIQAAQPVPVALLRTCAEYVADRPRPSTIDNPSSCSPKPKENVMTKNVPEPTVVDSGCRIAKRYAKLEHLESALALHEAQGEDDEAAHLRREIELLRPYLETGMNKEEAVAAYYRDHPEV
jgi:hypothetical protein